MSDNPYLRSKPILSKPDQRKAIYADAVLKIHHMIEYLDALFANVETFKEDGWDGWKTVYERAFGDISDDRVALEETIFIRLDYYDPSATYEEDVRALYGGLVDWANRVAEKAGYEDYDTWSHDYAFR